MKKCGKCGTEQAVATGEVIDDSYARREYPEKAEAWLDTDAGLLYVDMPVRDEHGLRHTAIIEVDHCPWCGRRLEGAE